MKRPAATALLSAPILALGNAVLPVGTRELARSPSSHLGSRAPVCQRDMTEVSNFVQNSFSNKAQLAYSMSGGGLAWSVCTIVNHNAGTEQPCTVYAVMVAAVVGGIIESQQKSTTPVEGAKASGRRQAPIIAHQTFADHIAAHGLVWEHIETPTIKRRDNTSDAIADHFIVRGVTHPNLTVTPADIHYTSFANGTGYVHAIHESAANSALQKRHDGAGFKYTWRCEYWDPNSQKPDLHSISVRLRQDISRNWAYDANYFALDQWIGAVGIDYILLKLIGVAIRIIPEIRGFGEEYEDVNICGDMNGPVHDELK